MEQRPNNTFEYNYSAPRQEELKRIRDKYLPREQTMDKMEQIRRLDWQAEQPAIIVSLVCGVVGTLVFGLGLSCVLVWKHLFVLGILVGIVGICVMAMAYPAHQILLKKGREKAAPQILQLIDELQEKK